uniref:Uncharacterized protein n=1 Tax=Arundo donax TaxID=35708 RepID=A0A0A9C4P3_ARUDO
MCTSSLSDPGTTTLRLPLLKD